MTVIRRLQALEILDSRGRPTLLATAELESGAKGTVSVPSGASTGAAEALELRDGDPKRYGGLGVLTAVANVNGPLNHALIGKAIASQAELDNEMLALDGTANKSGLGANALLAVSLAFARASAGERGIPLYEHFSSLLENAGPLESLPRPTVNLFSGGKHAGGQVEIQDVLIASRAKTVDQALAETYAVYQAAVKRSKSHYGMRALVADEGGLAPEFASIEAMLTDAVTAIADAGLTPGGDVAICVDVASSHFYENGRYTIAGETLTSAGMIDRVASWLDLAPIVSVEDGLAEDDWEHWPALRSRLQGKALALGDDFLTTNPIRIKRAIDSGSADALLLKVNQIGTLTEAAEACRLARGAGWRVVVSARSGETEDDWLTDLAVGWRGDALKVGSITRSERLAKWNRLLVIAAETGLPLIEWP